jgi:hypothetical protein
MGANIRVARFGVGGDDTDVGEEATETVTFTFWKATGGCEEGGVARFAEKVEAEVDKWSRLVPVERRGCQSA